MKRTVIAAALVALGTSPSAWSVSDADIAALRAEMATLRESYEARIAALEARLKTTEDTATEAAETATGAESRAGSRAPDSSAAFNPDVALILQGAYVSKQERPDFISGFIPEGEAATSRGFTLDATEIALSANIDPWFRGFANIAFADGAAEIEEAWFQTIGLDHGFTIKGGRFLSAIGYANEQHPHMWDFADNSLMGKALFGESFGQTGVQVKWLAPTDTFVELGAELGRGFTDADPNKNGAGSSAIFAHIGDDVGVSNSWRAGLSYLSAQAEDRAFDSVDSAAVDTANAFTGRSHTWIADLVWKWAPNGNPQSRNFKFQTEYFQRKEDGNLTCADSTATSVACATGGTTDTFSNRQSGWYAQGIYQFMPTWRVGYRYDRLSPGTVNIGATLAADFPRLATGFTPTKNTLMLDYSPSEFSRLRFQVARDESQLGLSETEYWVQYIYSLGSHGAHKF